MPAAAPIEHLYIHVPFCHRICPYCAFYKHLPGAADMDGFVGAVLAEAALYSQRLPIALKTVYLGGGTPTLLSQTHLKRLLEGLREIFAWERLGEFGLEVNPKTITPAKAMLLAQCGVTRASLGVQAWDAATLATLGRDHSPEEAAETFMMLRDAGIESLNIDLMFSIPGQTLETWAATLQRSLALSPNHISAYNLNFEEDTEFFAKLAAGQFQEAPERDAEFFYQAMDTLTAAGFSHYEISNYAQPGHESLHNAAYWFGKDYLGLGPSAVSTHANARWQNLRDTQRYVAALEAKIIPLQESEILTEDKLHIERVALELRTSKGVSMERLRNVPERTLLTLREEHVVEVFDNRVRLTRSGKILADAVAAAFLE